jgi:hypothetical protein
MLQVKLNKIKEIIVFNRGSEIVFTSGKYAGMCHVFYTANSNGQNVQVEYYFNKDGKSGYLISNVNGQTYATAWNG